MERLLIERPLWQSMLHEKAMKFHVTIAWVSIIVSPIWSISDMYIFPEEWKLYMGIDIVATLITLLCVVFRKRWNIGAENLGLIVMGLAILTTAYSYCNVEKEAFQQMTLIYIGILLGAGTFCLWRAVYSIWLASGAIITNALLLSLFSPLSIEEVLMNGGFIVLVFSGCMIFLTQIRYNFVKKDIVSQLALQESEEKFRQLINTASDAVITINKNEKIMMFNQGAEKIFGYVVDEIIGKSINTIVSEEFNEKIQIFTTSGEKTMSVGTIGRTFGKRKNGTLFPVEATFSKIMLNEGTLSTGILRDVSEQVKVKDALEKSEKQHRLLFYDNPVPMFLFSEEDNEIVEVNNAIINKYGYSRDEFKNLKKVNAHLFRSICDLVKQLKNDADKNSKPFNEWGHKLKNGKVIFVEGHVNDIDYLDNKIKLVSINDVTSVVYNEMELIAAKQKAENAKDMQSQFLSNMSHEIRTPMNGIIGMSRLLSQEELTIEQEKYLKAIKSSADNLMVIINDILDFSKIEAGKIVIEQTPFNLREQMDILCETLKIKAHEKSIYLKANIDDAIPKKLIGDPVRFNQILFNLIGNALKFTEKGGITINIMQQEISEDVVELLIEVQDTGIGISKEKLATIFDSFIQANRTTTRKYGGTGLGLTISKQLVELQGGKIWVNSAEQKGSIFSFTITYKKAKQLEEISSTGNTDKFKEQKILHGLGAIKVLLVEDHDINQLLALTVLEKWNFIVDLAENGLEAIEKVKENDYHVVLMDISMPEMDGYDATRYIRKKFESPKNQVPIIALTASALIGENQKCFKVGMNDFVAKPFDADHLLTKISEQVLLKQPTL